MHPILQNKYVRFGAIGLAAVLVLLTLFTLMSLLTQNSSFSTSKQSWSTPMAIDQNGVGRGYAMNGAEEMVVEMESSYYLPEPIPDGYTSDLESYETSTYSVTARTKDFDNLCEELSTLKVETSIHFKHLSTATNICRATFYTEEEKVAEVLDTLTAYHGVEVTRNTDSVTRHRQQIQSQTNILEQQLRSVTQSLQAAETQFDEIANFARTAKDAATLSEAIRYKLQNVDTLTQRKINLTSQLNRLYQQAADLEERLGVVQFNVMINRSNPISIGKYERQWEEAWEELKDAYTDTTINLSVFFGIFLLWMAQAVVYLLVTIIVLRGLWKFAKLVWRKW